MKIRPVGGTLFHADGRTDMTKLIVAFRNFAKAPKNEHISCRIPLYRLNGASYEYVTTRK